MLTNVRGNLNSIFVKILLGILVLAFAIWGIGPTMFAGNTSIVATVGEEEITTQDYYKAVQEQATTLQTTYGLKQPTNEIIKQFRIDQRVLAEMMMDAALRANATEMNISISKDVIADEMKKIDAFLVGGKLSRTAVEQYLQSSRSTYRELVADLELQVIRNQLAQTLFSFEPTSTRMAELLYAYDNERRGGTMITITKADITDVPDVTEEEIKTAYEKKKDSYKTLERRSYDYVLLTPIAFMDKVSASEEEIKAKYDSKASEYIIPESRIVNQVTFPTEEAAKDFIAKVTAGADFVKAAAEATDFKESEIALGSFTKDALASNFSQATADAVFALADKAMTVPMKSVAGFDVYQVSGIVEGKTTALDSVKTALETEIKQEKALKELYRVSQELDAEISAGTSFAALVEKFKFTVGSVDGIDRNYQTADGKPAVATREGAAVARKAFDLDTDEEPLMFNVEENNTEKGVFFVKVTKVDLPRQKTLEEMQPVLKEELAEKHKMDKAAEHAEKALERLTKGEDPQTIINELGGTSYSVQRISRKTDAKQSQNALTQNIRDLLFSLSKGGIDIERTADNSGYVVVRLDSITPADLSAQKDGLKAMKAEITKALSNDINTMYVTDLFKRFERTQNNALIQSLFQEKEQ